MFIFYLVGHTYDEQYDDIPRQEKCCHSRANVPCAVSPFSIRGSSVSGSLTYKRLALTAGLQEFFSLIIFDLQRHTIE
jgi:hypothetical protein